MLRSISPERLKELVARSEERYALYLESLPNYKTGVLFGPGLFDSALSIFNKATLDEPNQIIKLKRESWYGQYCMNGKYLMGEGVMAISPELLEKCILTEEDREGNDWVVVYSQPSYFD